LICLIKQLFKITTVYIHLTGNNDVVNITREPYYYMYYWPKRLSFTLLSSC